MKIVFQNVILLLSFVAYNYFCLAKDNINNIKIGVFSNQNESAFVNWSVFYDNILSNSEDVNRLEPIPIILPSSENFASQKTVCGHLASTRYHAVFGPNNSPSSDTIESIFSHLEIPYITTHRYPMNKKDVAWTFNLFPETKLFSLGLATIVKSLDWDRFIIIYENEESLSKLQDVLKIHDYEKFTGKNDVFLRELSPGRDYRALLKEIANLDVRKIILDCHVDKIMPILRQAQEIKLLSDFSTSIFLVSLDAHTLNFDELKISNNITTVRLFDPHQPETKKIISKYYPHRSNVKIPVETALRHDALLLLANTFNTLFMRSSNDEFIPEIKFCNRSYTYPDNDDYYRLYDNMKKVIVEEGLTGSYSLENGKRVEFNLQVITIKEPDNPIGLWNSGNPEDIHLTRNATETERQFRQRMKEYNFIISSTIAKPYLMESGIPDARGNARYRGFSMDLITEIAKIMNFNFTFHASKEKRANHIISELQNRKADLGICDFTITQERNEVIEFSLPFMTLGISILHKKADEEEINNMYAFMRPFSWTIWIYIITLYLVLSIIILFIARLDPDDWENPHPCNQYPEEVENIWGIKNCMWLTLGSIMTQGCDILPKGVCSRIATAMWWFFSLIMTSTYTANMAAFLTASKKDDTINSVEELAAQSKVKYGLMRNGATQTFFRRTNNSLYQKMWATMSNEIPSVFEDNNDKGVERVLNTKKGLYAFFMESPQIAYEMERHCELTRIGQTYLDSKSYGIGMPMGAEYRNQINAAVLQLQENGKLMEIKEKWWKIEDMDDVKCDTEADQNESQLTLANVGGVFIVLGAGIGLAFAFALIEMFWNVRNVSVEEHMTYMEALKCELKFACNITITKKAAKPVISESSSSKSEEDNLSLARTILAGAGSFLNINASVLSRLGADEYKEQKD